MAPSDTTDKPGPVLTKTIYEVQGLFPSDATLQDAISRLTLKGYDRADFSLPQTSPRAADATPEQGAENPNTDVDNRQVRTMGASMAGTAAAMAAAGVVIGTGGAAAPAVAAAAAAGLGAGLLSEGTSHASDAAQHESREQAAREGRLVLSVRAPDEAGQRVAVEEMRAAGATRVEPIARTDNAIEAAGWTG